jgi:hypothetical protein
MSTNYLIQLFLNPFFVLKIITLIMMFVFIIFILVVLNQVRSVSGTISQPKTPFVTAIGIIILLAAISLFLTSLAIL